MPHHKPLLSQIFNKIELATRQGLASLAVFDLDSTLFDVGPRLERILLEFAEDQENQRLFPEQVKHFKNIKVERGDWGVKDSLIRAGLDGHHPEFQEKVRAFWQKTFFSNEYLKYDTPYPGAVEYVNKLAKAGAEIIYLTGRDIHRMGQSSPEVLKHWNFPLDERHQLVLKPHRSVDDALFKKDWFVQLDRKKYAHIYFFENEPTNIHLIRESSPHVDIIFFDSTHSRKSRRPENIPAIMHFLLDEPSEEA